jgi:hypothetical protein
MLCLGFAKESPMKAFSMATGMTNMRGVFYPTGYMVLMLPTKEDARHAAELLLRDGVSEEDLCLVGPAEFAEQISTAIDEWDDVLLPTVGTELETARHFRALALRGEHALIIHASAKLTSDHVLELLKDCPISYGQRYRYLVIEDLVGE